MGENKKLTSCVYLILEALPLNREVYTIRVFANKFYYKNWPTFI
jgi:hypothetical protein